MRVELIENYLDNLIPNPKCELEFNSNFQLLVAVILSAQCTDKRVNMVTKEMFKKIDSIKTTRVPINNLLHNRGK